MVAILAGIVLVASLFKLVFKLTVAVGSLNGLIFFANLIDANSSVFHPLDRMPFIVAWL